MTELNQRVALITGGAKGIGRAVALDLAARGWAVAICYRSSVAEADEVMRAVRANGGTGLALQCDVSRTEAAEGLIEQVRQQWGRIDALINSAGPYHRVSLLKETVEGWHSMFDNNLHPVFYLTRAAIPIMRKRRFWLLAQPRRRLRPLTRERHRSGRRDWRDCDFRKFGLTLRSAICLRQNF